MRRARMPTGKEIAQLDLIVTGLVGLGGVLVGGALAGLIELWRQLLDGRAAARIVRMEIQDNVNLAVLSVGHARSDVARFKDGAWRDLRVKLVPLLPEAALMHMGIYYGAVFIVEGWAAEASSGQSNAKVQIKEWIDEIMLDAALLKQVQGRSRLAQMADLLLGRATFPTPAKGQLGMDKQLADRKKKVMDIFEGKA